MLLSTAAQAIEGLLIGTDGEFSSVSTNTRTLKPGDLFVALKGPNFNGHQFVQAAEKAGACALVVSEPVTTQLPMIQVRNTLSALGQLGAAWKAQFSIPTIAITGSCGKTTVKEMVAAILNQRGETLMTQGNYNNEIGVPLTLLSIKPEHQFAVIELGANHMGEIAYTTDLTKPDVAMVTNAGCAHIEGFGTAENVAKAKGEIFSGLNPNGKALINIDDGHADYWQSIVDAAQISKFSLLNPEADFYCRDIQLLNSGKYQFILHGQQQQASIELPLLGKHNILNAIAAAAAVMQVGASMDQVKQGLESIVPIKGRLYPVVIGNQLIIDDSYNANPASVEAAATLIADMKNRRCLVLGDMAELGTHATSLHRKVGEFVAQQGIDYLVVKGKHAADYLVGFNQAAKPEQASVRFDHYREIADFLRQQAPDVVLIKGSRSTAMENVLQLLQAQDSLRECC